MPDEDNRSEIVEVILMWKGDFKEEICRIDLWSRSYLTVGSMAPIKTGKNHCRKSFELQKYHRTINRAAKLRSEAEGGMKRRHLVKECDKLKR